VIPRLARSKTDPASQLYARFCQRLSRCGIMRSASEGPADFAARATELRPDMADAISGITRLYLALRYGRAKAGGLAELKRLVGEFRPCRCTRKGCAGFVRAKALRLR
jgi:hypothetical protein